MNGPKETIKSKVINVVLPSVICLAVFSISLCLDISNQTSQMFWLQRSGSIITILGAWIAFHESKESMQVVEGSLYIDTELPYKYISLIMIVLGTVLWGYGDIPFR